ncbi:MAG: glycosyltransferase family 4 protein [Longimicrobiaceae bacterium]
MRLLLVTGIFPPDPGGPAGYIPRVAAELSRRGHAVRVVCLSDTLVHDDSAYPFAVRRIARRAFLPARMLRTARAIRRWARDADVVLVNGLALEALLATGRRGVPRVHKVVGDTAWERARNRGWFTGTLDDYQRGGEKRRLLRLLDWMRTLPLRSAARVVVPSAYLRGIVAGWGVPAERTALVYNAVEETLAGPPGEAPAPRDPAPTVVTVCRLVPWKGVDGLIRAVAGLSGVRLVVVGDGPQRGALEALAEACGLAGRVRFTGTLSAREVRRELGRADVFVLNSSYEGLPHVVLEAMAERVPVVATAAGGTGELVRHGDTGLLVPVGDEEALRGAIRRLLDDPRLREALREGALRRMHAEFSLAHMVEATERILRESAPPAGAPGR